MLLLAHRGASADAPENTLEAFAEAVRQGADGVELDARVCGSGEVVVCHDEKLDRLAGMPWGVRTTAWWKLQRADVGTPLGFSPARIPLLEEVLDALPAHFLVNIELKSGHLDDGGLAHRVAGLVTQRGRGGVDRLGPARGRVDGGCARACAGAGGDGRLLPHHPPARRPARGPSTFPLS